MAEPIAYPNKNDGGIVINDVLLAEWVLANGQAGAALKSANFSDQNIHFYGEFSTGGSITLRGSNKVAPDPDVDADWFTLRAAHDGSDISGVTTFYGAVILESVMWVSPKCVAGDSSTLINCSLKANKRK